MQPSVISTKHGFVYHSVTKTGSQSMERTLLKRFAGRRGSPVVKRREGYLHFAVCRDPYDWAVSTWWATCKRQGDQYGMKEHGETFEQFVLWVGGRPEIPPSIRDLLIPQNEQLPFKMDRMLRFEHLQQEFEALPFAAGSQLPHLNTTAGEREHWDVYITRTALGAVHKWLNADFDLFNYRRLSQV